MSPMHCSLSYCPAVTNSANVHYCGRTSAGGVGLTGTEMVKIARAAVLEQFGVVKRDARRRAEGLSAQEMIKEQSARV